LEKIVYNSRFSKGSFLKFISSLKKADVFIGRRESRAEEGPAIHV